MLGGGNPVAGSNPSGTGSNLNYIGNHVYAHSGSVAVNNSDVTLLEFSVAANQYITAKITIGSKAGTGDDLSYAVIIDGEQVYSAYEALVNMPTQNALNILLAPGSKVQIQARNLGSASGREVEVVLVGRVYA
jgi:archaellum component FlaG (FlaF/FlaG flagellin family)